MKPIIYESKETSFRSQGKGTLSDCISCIVKEELNGSYELEMTLPVDGKHAEFIQARNIIVCRASYSKTRQAFRIYKVKRNINRTLTVYARHVSYDLSNYPVLPFTASGVVNAVNGLVNNVPSALRGNYSITALVNTAGTFKVEEPSSIRSWFGGKEGSLIDIYGGEWDFDNFDCYLKNKRGNGDASSPVLSIKYAKNLTKYDKETDSDSEYSHIIAIWKKTQDDVTEVVYSQPQPVENVTGYVRCGYCDVSSDYDEKPTTETLNIAAKKYISEHKLSGFANNISVDFIQLENERVELGDYVRIFCDGENYVSRIIKTEWNVLLDRYKTVEVGDKKANIVDAIQSLNSSPSASSGSSSPTLEHVTAYNGGMEFFCYGRQVTCHLNGLTYAQLLAYVVAGKWKPLTKCRWTIQGEYNNGIVLGIAEIDTNGQFAAYYYSGFNETKKNWASDWKLYGVTTWISNS